MKFIIPSVYLLAHQALAQDESKGNENDSAPAAAENPMDIDKVEGVFTAEVTNMNSLEALIMQAEYPDQNNAEANLPDGQRGRSFAPGVDMIFANLQEYGCWCFFNDKHGQGRGQPVDVFDSHCMKYHHGVSCAKLEIDNCDPYSTTYSITAKQSGNNGDVVYDCETGNNPCQEATCYAQSHFISLLLKEQLANLQVPSYPQFSSWKDGGNFDSSTCKISGPGQLRQEMCCGSWKYNTKKLLRFGQHLSRACCDQPDGGFKTYDNNLASCCSDGSVRVHGTC